MSESLYQDLVKKLHKAQKEKDTDKENKILFEIGILYYEKGDSKRSRAIFQDLLKQNKKLEKANYYIALTHLYDNNSEKAIEFLKKELKVNKKADYAIKLREKLEVHTNFPAITLSIIIINLVTFFYTYPQITFSNLIKYGVIGTDINFWQLITSLFLHANAFHLVVNMAILAMFGLYLEKNIGSLRFLFIFLIAGIFGNLLQTVANIEGFVIGASAGIFGILGAVIMREPLLNVKLFGLIRTPIILVFGGFFLFESLIDLFFETSYIVLGNYAHIGGFLFGILLTGIMYQETIEVFYNWLFISLGFWILSYSIRFLIEGNYTTIPGAVTIFSLGVLGAASIVGYSYYKLKLLKLIALEQNGENN